MNKVFFSEKENGTLLQNTEDISSIVFNGIIGVFNEFKTSMSAAFPERCPDNGMAIDFEEKLFKDSMLSLIPDFKLSEYGYITTINEYTDFNKYSLLDFLEYCWLFFFIIPYPQSRSSQPPRRNESIRLLQKS